MGERVSAVIIWVSCCLRLELIALFLYCRLFFYFGRGSFFTLLLLTHTHTQNVFQFVYYYSY